MNKILSWVKNNKLAVALMALFLGYWWLNNGGFNRYSSFNSSGNSYEYGGVATDSYVGVGMGAPSALSMNSRSKSISMPQNPVAPSESSDRMMVQNGSISLLVKNVSDTQKKISEYVKAEGGYLVNSNVTRPSEQPYGQMSVRIMASKLDATFEFFRSLGMKVTSENISGYDVTDQYEDLDTRLTYLQRSLAQIQAIQDSAKTYEDILSGTREIISLQEQIDNLKGRQLYLEQTAKLALVDISMSTDEFALPYAPDSNFRPGVIMKLAIRSLITTLQGVGEWAIWIAVYSIIWLPLLIVGLVVRKVRSNKTSTKI